MQATFTSNDLVIQKLSQILSYLRTGRTSKKIKKKDSKKTEVRRHFILPRAGNVLLLRLTVFY